MTGPSSTSPSSGAAAVEARAAALREQWLHEQRTSRLDDHTKTDRLSRARDTAKAGAADADKDAGHYLTNAKETLKEAAAFDAEAKKLEFKNPKEAQEYRELAAERRANAEEMTGLATAAQREGDRYRSEAARLAKEHEAASEASVKHMVALEDAERHIDRLEDKAASLRKAEQALEYAEESDRDAVRFRAEGNQKAADTAVANAAKYRANADAAQKEAEAKVVDETVFATAGLSDPDPTTAPAAPPASTTPPAAAGASAAADEASELDDPELAPWDGAAVAGESASADSTLGLDPEDDAAADPAGGESLPAGPTVEPEQPPMDEQWADAGEPTPTLESEVEVQDPNAGAGYTEAEYDAGTDAYAVSDPGVDETTPEFDEHGNVG